jgi:hypothetical protein
MMVAESDVGGVARWGEYWVVGLVQWSAVLKVTHLVVTMVDSLDLL